MQGIQMLMDNVFIGNETGFSNTGGTANVMIGNTAGKGNLTGDFNVFLGWQAGIGNTSGNGNVMIGQFAGQSNTIGTNNICIGLGSGFSLSGNSNVTLGVGAGQSVKGDKNVMLGPNAGNSETRSEKLYIENSNVDSTAALIWGDFANDILRLNGRVGIGINPTTKFAIANLPGTSSGTYLRIFNDNIYYLSSSRKTKKDIEPLVDDFTKILNAKPVSFTDIESGEINIGFIAEDFDEIGLNKLVVYKDGKPISLSYELISIYNLEIIKEQQKQIEQQKSEFEALKAELEAIKALLKK
jgi:hypothetical protein